MSGRSVVGIDIGGTGTRFVVMEPTTRAILARSSSPTPAEGSADEVAAFLRDAIRDLVPTGRVLGVGIGASGPVDADGVIQNPDTLPAFTGVPLLAMFDSVSEQPPVIDNDAVTAALGEHAVGVAVGTGRSLHVTLGTGIGVCLLESGVPFRNADGSHPEAGHLTVATPAQPCYCGRQQCWEQTASRQSLQRSAARLMGREPGDHRVLAELSLAASAGDEAAEAVFDTYGRAVAEGLSSVVTAYGPEMVVLGGSAAGYLTFFHSPLNEDLSALAPWVPLTSVFSSALDDFGGAVGAAILAARS